ncbi:serine/threonine-protein kinase RIO3-like isoform X1 [Leguminivora glycinivorella]|uniref:serine/threonine-protein kinase RIO3-like isoform X1 n=1 Tax=Leguminivora glycinivorella TaxID=1035111 RepID=UPI00200C107A|nr:serine/threonine-protein kinase RIO3-like isoform X1 [Leguminivora glycinivorella]
MESEQVTGPSQFFESDEFDSDYYDFDHDDYKLESRAKLPIKGHQLKHGRVLNNRGSNQEKFLSVRPKTLVKYGKCYVPSAYNFDEETQSIINDSVDKYNYFTSVNGAIMSGERAVLLHCTGHQPSDPKEKPREYLLKVYNKQFGKQMIEKWILNEYASAWHMFKHINVPNVFPPSKNVGSMDFIGDDGKPAPSLQEVTFKITEKIYTDVVTSMYKMYNDAKRVHGNLSPRNMLWWRDKLYFVSLSRSVETSHPIAQKLLMRDCCYVTHFFKSKGLLKVKSILNLFKYITGVEQPDPGVLLALKHNRKQVKNKQKKNKPPHEMLAT